MPGSASRTRSDRAAVRARVSHAISDTLIPASRSAQNRRNSSHRSAPSSISRHHPADPVTHPPSAAGKSTQRDPTRQNLYAASCTPLHASRRTTRPDPHSGAPLTPGSLHGEPDQSDSCPTRTSAQRQRHGQWPETRMVSLWGEAPLTSEVSGARLATGAGRWTVPENGSSVGCGT